MTRQKYINPIRQPDEPKSLDPIIIAGAIVLGAIAIAMIVLGAMS